MPSDNRAPPVADPLDVPAVAPVDEQEMQAAHEPETEPEPKLDKTIRFEAGTVHDLMAHIKEWIEWRLSPK